MSVLLQALELLLVGTDLGAAWLLFADRSMLCYVRIGWIELGLVWFGLVVLLVV